MIYRPAITTPWFNLQVINQPLMNWPIDWGYTRSTSLFFHTRWMRCTLTDVQQTDKQGVMDFMGDCQALTKKCFILFVCPGPPLDNRSINKRHWRSFQEWFWGSNCEHSFSSPTKGQFFPLSRPAVRSHLCNLPWRNCKDVCRSRGSRRSVFEESRRRRTTRWGRWKRKNSRK